MSPRDPCAEPSTEKPEQKSASTGREQSEQRPHLIDHFERWTREYVDDPHRQDACNRANRVYALLSEVTPAEDDSAIPPTSLLREFIGGSAYEY